MTSFLRAIQPQLMSLFWTLCFVWVVAFIARHFLDQEYKKWAVRIGFIVSALVVVGFIVFAANFAVINEIPRATIDRSTVEKGRSNFEERMKEEAAKPKSEGSTTTTPTKEGEKK